MRRLRRLPIRARLSIAFSAALLIVLVLAAAFVYVRVDTELTDSAEDGLRSRLVGLQALIATQGPGDPALQAGTGLDAEDGFSQVLAADGSVIASTLLASDFAALSPGESRAIASGQTLLTEMPVPGIDGEALVLAGPADDQGRAAVAVVGVTTQDRTEALAGILGAFAIGAPIAVLLAAGAGLLLARRAMEPVEAMRARAEEIGGEARGERLPLPEADDEIHSLGVTLNSMLGRLEESLERERDFVADASHELRTPLAILKAELELAETDPDLGPAGLRETLLSAQEEVDRLTRLADDLLVAARADRGEISIRRETARLDELIARVAARFKRTLDAAGRTVEIETDGPLSAEVDPLRVEQITANLLDNAIRHGEGRVRIGAERTPGGSVVLEVSDEGTGLPPDFAATAFERFSRPDSGRSGGGAGLGLAIVRALARAHGGDAELGGDGAALVRVTLAPA